MAGATTLKALLKNSNTHKTSLLQSVPVYRMEKIISDMSKYKQLIKQLILFVPREEKISRQAHICRKKLFTFSSKVLVLARFLDFPF